jgi:hypothetical protein
MTTISFLNEKPGFDSRKVNIFLFAAKSTRAVLPTAVGVMYSKYLNELLSTSLCWPLMNYIIFHSLFWLKAYHYLLPNL